MSAFDGSIRELRVELDALRRRPSTSVRELRYDGPAEALLDGLPVAVGPGANPGVILRSDTAIELGNPGAGSCATLLWTDDPSLVDDGVVTLLGPDIPTATGQSLPFAQLVFVAGAGLTEDDHEDLVAAQHVSDQVGGYMARSTSEYVWSRVDHDAVARGFDFGVLGRALLHLVKQAAPEPVAVEVAFVTTGKDDVSRLGEGVARAREIARELLADLWRKRGFDLDCDFDCGSCGDQDTCDDIREMIVATKKAPAGADQERGR